MAANTSGGLTAAATTGGLRVGIIDSDISRSGLLLRAARTFCGTSTSGEHSQHGTRIAELFKDAIVPLEICAAQVFDQRLSCSPGQVAEAIHWLIEQDVRLINMSFGLRADRPVLREACAAALAAGICLVAASPAQGDPVYPAAYPGVLRATGDARCHPGQIAWLDSAQADFGGYPGNRETGFVGASAGCAAVCVALAELAVDMPQMNATDLGRTLAGRADYRGPERRAPEPGVVAS
jgi:hypothetical protein